MNYTFVRLPSPLRLISLAAVLLVIPTLVAAAEEHPLQDLIRKSFLDNPIGPGFFMKSRNGNNHVEVCGDICAYFDWIGDGNDEKLWRFIVLYELNDGPGKDVADYLPNAKKMSGHDLVEPRFCAIKGADIASINCDWMSYSRSLGISVGHARYDEGRRCYAKGLDREWERLSKLEWKCAPMKESESPFVKHKL